MSSGLDAAMERYRGLREEHYGLGRYDFGARSLNAMGRQLVDMGRAADASKFYRMGIEFHPESAELYAGLAMAVFQADDVEGGERSAGAGL